MTVEKLKKKRNIRRIIEIGIAAIFLTCGIVFKIIKEEPSNYIVVAIISIFAFVMTLIIFGLDLLFTRIYSIDIDGEMIIIYNNLLIWKLIVNGEERDSTFMKSYMETKLKSGLKLTASSQFFASFHISLSDGRTVDL